MSRRVELAHGVSAVFVIVVATFALGALAIGLLLALGAGRIAAAQPQLSVPGLVIGGALLVIAGGLGLRWALGSLGAVATIVVEDDRSWTLRSRFGRVLGTVPSAQPRHLHLRGHRVYLVAATVPRRQDIVGGTLVVDGGKSYRLADAGPASYDRSLSALGYQHAAPRPGERVEL